MGASETVTLQTEDATVDQSFGEAQLTRLPNTEGLSVLGVAVAGPASQPGTDELENGDAGFFRRVSNSVNIAGLGIAQTDFLHNARPMTAVTAWPASCSAPAWRRSSGTGRG